MSLEPIEERVLEEGRFIAERGATVREAAARFHVSKSTVHKDLVERLPRLAPALSACARRVLDRNKAERHLRGGEATMRKFACHKREREAEAAGK